MGTSNSCLPTCLNTQKRSYRHLSSLKLTYNHPELLKYNPININEASEDELLLLPGVTRQTAQNILQYRHMNDGFKEIKEISQVSGISSDVYQRIYCDISIDSLSNQSHKLININLASYNELCSIPGLTPALVSKILRHREAKGLFSFIEDLLKIKGINYTILATIRPHVIVDEQQTLNQNNNNNNTNSIESNLLETPPPELELSSSNKNIFRFASWNLQQLTNDKVQNLGVREVICRVILENK
jgi:competence protein ComEA